MKSAWLCFVFLVGGIFFAAMAQIPQGTHLTRSHMPSYRHTKDGNILDYVVSGSNIVNLGPQLLSLSQFELDTFRNGDPKQTNIIAQAPQCEVDISNNIASDPGPIKIFTPTGKLYVQGVGFIFTQTNHLLIISNQVETRVIKSMLKSPMLAAPKTNAVAAVEQVLKIFADWGRFNLDSNVVDYSGHVHLIDPQLDLTSDFLTIRFTSNGAVQSVLARQNVVLTTTNNGVATGETGYYYLVGTNEMMKLTADATWRNGDQSAKAQEFTYDSTRHFLTGSNRVQVRWPNQPQKLVDGAANPATAPINTNGFRELFADFATLQFPPTNGPVQNMRARGNVIIINDGDQSKAMSEKADYDRAADRVDLTGDPVWWNTNMEVRADLLTADLGGKTYHAQTNAHFKMRTGSTTNQVAVDSGQPTNKWVFIASDSIEYQTNEALFLNNVKAQMVVNEQVQDTLDCNFLLLSLTNNKLERAVANGEVYGETAPDKTGVIKTITCKQLIAELSVATGLLKTIDAQTNVVIKEKGTGPTNLCNTLSADFVTAQFSAVTNQIERAVAERNVVLDQLKGAKTTHATARHGVYTAANDQVRLTGAPIARSETDLITDSELMIWRPKANTFQAFGRYKIIPLKVSVARKAL